jgi:hypothetical protein
MPSTPGLSACRKSGKNGAIIELPIAQNISLPQLSKLNPNGVLNDAKSGRWRTNTPNGCR